MGLFHIVNGEGISLSEMRALFVQHKKIELSEIAIQQIDKCRNYLDEKMKEPNATFYGVNTGFGALCNVRIEGDKLLELQENLVLSHAA